MKKSLLLTLFAIGVIQANAQITITTADIAVPVKVIYQSTDSTSTTLNAGSAGTNQTWNMASLADDVRDTLNFIPYNWAPNSTFSSSNLVVQQGSIGVYLYLLNNASALSILGTHATLNFGATPITLNQINNPAEKIISFPYTYNSGFTNNYVTNTPPFATGAAIAGVDSARMRSQVHKVAVVDAWGSITTPLGTFPVVRSKEYKVTHDTTDVHNSTFGIWIPNIQTTADSSATYTFWANSVGFPLVTVNMDSAGVADIQWLRSIPAVGINEYTSAVQTNVYPNPAQNEINVAVDPSMVSAVQIYDIMGKLVASFPISTDVTNVNTSGFANGAYTFSVIGKDKSVLTRGKFSIAK
jgi:hypothetical protein